MPWTNDLCQIAGTSIFNQLLRHGHDCLNLSSITDYLESVSVGTTFIVAFDLWPRFSYFPSVFWVAFGSGYWSYPKCLSDFSGGRQTFTWGVCQSVYNDWYFRRLSRPWDPIDRTWCSWARHFLNLMCTLLIGWGNDIFRSNPISKRYGHVAQTVSAHCPCLCTTLWQRNCDC